MRPLRVAVVVRIGDLVRTRVHVAAAQVHERAGTSVHSTSTTVNVGGVSRLLPELVLSKHVICLKIRRVSMRHVWQVLHAGEDVVLLM